MYEDHFQFREKPFSMFPDPSFIYWGERYALAYAMLEYGVLSSAGITVVTGEVGCGKTTLVRHLLSHLGEDVTVGLLSNTHQASNDLIRWVLMAFEQPFEQKTGVGAFRDFQAFVIAQYAQGKRTLLIVDEAQNLSVPALEELRMLSNINSDKECLLQIVLTGQPQLRDMLRRPELEQFAQRVASDFHVEPLETADVHRYIKHRLVQAGSPVRLFSKKACDIVAAASHGVPRTINLLCDTALVYAYARGQKHVTSHVTKAVIADKQKYGVFKPETDIVEGNSETSATLSSKDAGPHMTANESNSVPGRNFGLRLASGQKKEKE